MCLSSGVLTRSTERKRAGSKVQPSVKALRYYSASATPEHTPFSIFCVAPQAGSAVSPWRVSARGEVSMEGRNE